MLETTPENIQQAIEQIQTTSIELLANNLYDAITANWHTPAKQEPFSAHEYGTHAAIELVVPNMHATYNASNKETKQKLIDAAAWLITNKDAVFNQDYNYTKGIYRTGKPQLHMAMRLIQSFSGQENYPMTYAFGEESKYHIKEQSQEIRAYIKNIYTQALLTRLPKEEHTIYPNLNPMEIIPKQLWLQRMQEGYEAEVFLTSLHAKSFFNEKKYFDNINTLIENGLTVQKLQEEATKGPFGTTIYKPERYIKKFNQIKDEKTRNEFINYVETNTYTKKKPTMQA